MTSDAVTIATAATACRDVDRYPGAELVPGIVAVRLDAPVYFANVMHFENKIKDFVEDGHSFAHNHGGMRYCTNLLGRLCVKHVTWIQLSVDHLNCMPGTQCLTSRLFGMAAAHIKQLA